MKKSETMSPVTYKSVNSKFNEDYWVAKRPDGKWTVYSKADAWAERDEFPNGLSTEEDAILIAKEMAGIKGEFDKFENGGPIDNEEEIDLFEYQDELPEEVQEVLNRYSEEDFTYEALTNMSAELKPLGYTFEWGLDAEPYGLKKITMAKGGPLVIDETPLIYLGSLKPEFLPENAAKYLRDNLLTDTDLNLLSNDFEGLSHIKTIIMEKYPKAITGEVIVEVEPTLQDLRDSLDGAQATLEFLTGQDRQDMQDYIDGLEVLIDSIEPPKMAFGGPVSSLYFQKLKDKLKGHSEKFDKEHIKIALEKAHEKIKQEAANAKNKVDFEIEQNQHKYVLNYLKKYSTSKKLNQSEKRDIIEAWGVLNGVELMEETLSSKNIFEGLVIENKKLKPKGMWIVSKKHDNGIWEIKYKKETKILFDKEFHLWKFAPREFQKK